MFKRKPFFVFLALDSSELAAPLVDVSTEADAGIDGGEGISAVLPTTTVEISIPAKSTGDLSIDGDAGIETPSASGGHGGELCGGLNIGGDADASPGADSSTASIGGSLSSLGGGIKTSGSYYSILIISGSYNSILIILGSYNSYVIINNHP